jgi:hypothetical protein
MLKNERQYATTKAQADKFARALEELIDRPAAGVHPVLRNAEEDAVRSQLADLQAELEQFERLPGG